MVKLILFNFKIIGLILTASSTVLLDKAISKKSFSDRPFEIKYSLAYNACALLDVLNCSPYPPVHNTTFPSLKIALQ